MHEVEDIKNVQISTKLQQEWIPINRHFCPVQFYPINQATVHFITTRLPSYSSRPLISFQTNQAHAQEEDFEGQPPTPLYALRPLI